MYPSKKRPTIHEVVSVQSPPEAVEVRVTQIFHKVTHDSSAHSAYGDRCRYSYMNGVMYPDLAVTGRRCHEAQLRQRAAWWFQPRSRHLIANSDYMHD
jgi:hypothetical protein